MKSELISTGLILKELQCFNINTLRDRILLQKKVYLLQQIGVNLGLSYSWYLHGPYSKELTALAYQCVPMGEDIFLSYSLKSAVISKVEQINNLFLKVPKTLKMEESDWYELIASIVYSQKQGREEKDAIQEVLKLKPKFNQIEAEAAIKAWENIKLR